MTIFLKNALLISIAYKSATVLGFTPEEMVPLAAGLFILPFFLFSALAGQLADKYEKTKLIKIIKFAEILIMALAAVGFLKAQQGLLLTALFLMGCHSTLFGPLKYSILPQHLEAEELVSGNALVEAGTFVAILLGLVCGGLSVARTDGPLVVGVGLLSVALVGFFFSWFIPPAPSLDPNLKVNWNTFSQTFQIYKFLKRNRSVYLSILGISWFWFFGAAILTVFPIYGKTFLHAQESVVTLILAIFSIGIGVGSVLCAKLSKRRLELGLVPLGSIGMSYFTLHLYSLPKPSIAYAFLPVGAKEFILSAEGSRIVVDLLALSIFSGLFIVPLYTLIQERAEKQYRSRTIAGNNILNSFFMVFASILLLLLFKFDYSIPQIFLVLGILNTVVAIYIYTLLPEFLMRFIMWILAHIMYRLKVTGLENIPKHGSAVLVCNHVSFVDWMIISAAVPQPIRFIMDHNYVKGFVLRTLIKQAKVILIAPAHENEKLMHEAFHHASAELRDDNLLCIFPEGKITKTGDVNVFKPGVKRILEDNPVPVIPMALRGLWGSIFSRKGGRALSHWPTRFWYRVELVIGKPIAADTPVADMEVIVKDLRGRFQ